MDYAYFFRVKLLPIQEMTYPLCVRFLLEREGSPPGSQILCSSENDIVPTDDILYTLSLSKGTDYSEGESLL